MPNTPVSSMLPEPPRPTVAAYTLGCKVNQADTDTILRQFLALGFREHPFPEKADVYLINTCTVTQLSGKKSRQVLSRAHKNNPQALVIACGCHAKTEAAALRALPGVSLVFPPEDRDHIAAAALAQVLPRFPHLSPPDTPPAPQGAARQKAYLKIQDGCNRFCSYCIVPFARGAVKSVPPSQAVAAARQWLAEGFKEIVLTGIQLAAYGDDLENATLSSVMARIHALPQLEKLYLGSLESALLTPDFVREAAALPKLQPHFHVSLQSGCDRTLARMRRRYTAAEYAEGLARLRHAFPGAVISTDVIVGFPGETAEDFQESLDFCRKMDFSHLHVFMYSAKPGTAAAGFAGQIPHPEKVRRSQLLRHIKEEIDE